MKELIKRVLKEEVALNHQKLKDLTSSWGVSAVSDYVGGIKNYIDMLYNGDIKKFSKDTNVDLVKIRDKSMYLHDALVRTLNLKDAPRNEKELGKFSFGPNNGLRYSFTSNLIKVVLGNGLIYWRVVGTSGDSGIGYGFLTQKQTLGKRYCQQIFKQIIDKYGLREFIV